MEHAYEMCPGVRRHVERLFRDVIGVAGPVPLCKVRLLCRQMPDQDRLPPQSRRYDLELIAHFERTGGAPDFHRVLPASEVARATMDAYRKAMAVSRNRGLLLDAGALWARICEDSRINSAVHLHRARLEAACRAGASEMVISQYAATFHRAREEAYAHAWQTERYDPLARYEPRTRHEYRRQYQGTFQREEISAEMLRQQNQRRVAQIAEISDTFRYIIRDFLPPDYLMGALDFAPDPLPDLKKERERQRRAKTRAQVRGLVLLREHCTPFQWQEYKAFKYFHAKGNESGRTYRIKHGRQQNVYLLDDRGEVEIGLCFLPYLKDGAALVEGDCMLAQKLTLELNESEALKVAHRFGGPSYGRGLATLVMDEWTPIRPIPGQWFAWDLGN